MKNIKIRIFNEQHSTEVQSCLFYFGCEWVGEGSNVCHTSKPFLYVDGKLIAYGTITNNFDNHRFKEVTLEDLQAELHKSENPIVLGENRIILVNNPEQLEYITEALYRRYGYSIKPYHRLEWPHAGDDGEAFILLEGRQMSVMLEIPPHCGGLKVYTMDASGEFVPIQRKEPSRDEPYDEKGNATHYTGDRISTIEAMERVYGTKAVFHYCEITAFKYRSRLGRKEGADVNLDLTKAKWYERAAKHYHTKITDGEGIHSDTETHGLPWEN